MSMAATMIGLVVRSRLTRCAAGFSPCDPFVFRIAVVTPEYLCFACVGDPHLKAEIRQHGQAGVCLECGAKRPAYALGTLGDRIDEALFAHYVVDESEQGPGYESLIQQQAGLSQKAAEAVRNHMSATRGFAAAKDGETNLWADACFEEAPLDREGYRRRWAAFRSSIREEGRFYNRTAEAILDDIFQDVLDARTWRGQPAVTTIEPSTSRDPLIRGRVAKSDVELKAILGDPAAQLGPPPSHLAAAGRMNAAGVSVFYCSYDQTICCQECRPPAGSHMVYGYFDLVRPVRVLNLSLLASMTVPEQSIFAPGSGARIERAGFLRQLDWEISQPVMPGDEGFGYLHTQAVADYLAHRLGLDGVLYRSTQSGAGRAERDPAQNLVLFHHASRVEPLDLRNWEVDVDLGGWDEDQQDGDDGISISAIEKSVPDAPKTPPNPLIDWFEAEQPEPEDKRPVSLRIRRDRIDVERISAATYDRDPRCVTHRITSLADRAESEARYARMLDRTGVRPGDHDL